jgi:A/G-specific adenine glycosylase
VRHLANASEAEVLAQWSGLGYYRRARMLHAAAKLLVKDHQGRIPRSAAELRTLAGIGRYTSNAIASIAFGEPVAVVDGNVERVIHRLTCGEITGESVWDTAQNLLDPVRPGDFNQAMMELGATICVPGVPDCVRCPVKQHCQTHSSGASPSVPADKKVRIRQSASVLLAVRARGLALCQRKAADRLMPGMWELPSTTGAGKCEPLLVVKHSITRTDWTITVFRDGVLRRRTDGLVRWVPLDDVSRLPLTGLTRKILRRLNLLA